MRGKIEKQWLEQGRNPLEPLPVIYDHETGLKYPVVLPILTPYIGELEVWMEREKIHLKAEGNSKK